jgi:hypothetical protein
MQTHDETRRAFLKRSAYAAPTVLMLGTLTGTQKAHAGFGGPPSDPGEPITSTSSADTSDDSDNGKNTNEEGSTEEDSLVLDSVQG